jgi:hypothetical protein
MADVTLYLHPGLATGSNNGSSAADAFQTWAGALAYLGTNHADLVTAQESVDVIVLGSTVDEFNTELVLDIVSNSTYKLRFVADPTTATPGIFDATKPGWERGADDTDQFTFNMGGASAWVEFVGLNFYDPDAYKFSSQTNMFYNPVAAASGSRLVFRNCYFKADQSTAGAIKYLVRLQSTNIRVIAENCVFDGFTGATNGYAVFRDERFSSEGVSEVYNCTFVNCPAVLSSTSSGQWRWVNNLVSDSSISTGIASSGKNVTNQTNVETTLPGSDNTYEATFSFVSSTDRHITAANGLGAGPSDVTYGTYVPTTDIDGDTRSGEATDAGADFFVSAATGPTLTSDTVTSQDSDGFTLGFTTDTANGTAYYVVYSTAATAPSAAQVLAGTDGDDVAATASGSKSVTATGAQTFTAITGLNPGTTYAYSIVHYGVPA